MEGRQSAGFFPTFERWVDGLKEMADVVGVDHVCIGADHASREGLLQGYEHFDRLVDAMLRGGFTPAETARIAGGNYLRIFAACAG
jgi:membrane dipeptidase